MQLEINTLLDEDSLSPQQERYVRKLVDYNLYKELNLAKTGEFIYSLSYVIPFANDDFKHRVSARTPEELRAKAYGCLMRYAINYYSNSVIDITAINEIKYLIKENTTPIQESDYAKDEFHFYLNGELHSLKERDFKQQVFFKILKIVIDNKRL